MPDKKKPTDKPSNRKMSEEEASAVIGGLMPKGTGGQVGGGLGVSVPEPCLATDDTGHLGCPG